ncbi:MAG: histidine kinase dimerization/phospho-acceptor domain-containing protein, partial [Terracidiphilus sp.]
MDSNLFKRLQATLLAVVTAALFVLAVLNLQEENHFQQPDDGVWWREVPGGLEAEKVLPDMPGQRAGIQPHDLLTGAQVLPDTPAQSNGRNGGSDLEEQDLLPGVDRLAVNPSPRTGIQPKALLPKASYATIITVADLERIKYDTGPYGKASYAITRGGIALDTPVVVILEPADKSLQLGLRIIGVIYLAIGIYVLFRRWTAPRATHFYLFCLASFALYALKYTGKLDVLDWGVFWCNVLAESLQPALFLHFALSFPEERLKNVRRRVLLPFVYAPGAALLGLWIWSLTTRQATGLLLHSLNQWSTGYVAAFYVGAALLFVRSYRLANTPLQRQQLKWLTRGALLAIVPFTFYAVLFIFDVPIPGKLSNVAALFLVFLPLTFAWAIVRYRLMDTDLIFKRGVAYTLATGLMLGASYGAIAVIAVLAHNGMPAAVREWGLGITIVLLAAIFDPLKRRIQGWVDRAFDRHRYDYRKALVEFGRSLSSETNLEALLSSIVERLPRTLLVARVAIFMAPESGQASSQNSNQISATSGRLRLAASHGLPSEARAPHQQLALGFLDFDQATDHSHIFFENAQAALHLPENQQRTAALLDLNYYLPCRVQDGSTTRTIAVIGLGRTIGGDFLSSEDVELLESLASYIGIAIQNASLYSLLQEKISEFERLKEFNENIVESINVGILAVDLEDRIESWNAQMEAMYAFSRSEALGQPLSAVFPTQFVDALEGFRNEPGVHHLYKFRLTTRAGELRTANIAIAPLLSRDFVSVGRIILVDDITERVSLETQLAQADKLSSIGLLAAGVAHEINTPLAVISSYAQMLSKQFKGDARFGPVLEKITQQSFRAAEIANGLLNFSRTSTTEFRDTDLNQVIRDTLSLLEHQFRTAQILVDLDLNEGLPPIHGNSGKLQQVFLNLLLNAKEAMPGGGRLR